MQSANNSIYSSKSPPACLHAGRRLEYTHKGMDKQNDDAIAHFFGGTGAADDTDFSLDTPEQVTVSGETDEEGEIAVDVYQTDTQVVVVSPLAGVDPNEIEIAAGDDSVTISGERKAEHTEQSENVFTQEIYWGSFSRTVELPVPCDIDKAAASFKHGVLTVKIPKAGKAKKLVIKVKTTE